MSYDLNFWKQKPGMTLDPQEIYERLCNGDRVEGLEELPVEKMLASVRTAFADGWTQLGALTWDGPEKAFQIYTTSQYFRVDCYGMSGEDMNVFIDIGSDFGCPLYDPQVGKRFD